MGLVLLFPALEETFQPSVILFRAWISDVSSYGGGSDPAVQFSGVPASREQLVPATNANFCLRQLLFGGLTGMCCNLFIQVLVNDTIDVLSWDSG